jgi:hypothetical protein
VQWLLNSETLIARNDEVGMLLRTLAVRPLGLLFHSLLPLRARTVSIPKEPTAEALLCGDFDPDGEGNERPELFARGGESFNDEKWRRWSVMPLR